MEGNLNKLRDLVSTMLGGAALDASVGELRRGIALKGQHTYERLLSRLAELVGKPSELREERDRVLLGRLIVALVPRSIGLMESLLKPADQGEGVAELQFSLFVALSDALESGRDRETLPILLALVQTYLLQIARDEVQAAWMAGDLLGDHWPLDTSLPILLNAAKHADHPAGREAALHGLSHALARGTKRQQWEIMEALREVSGGDSSASVRSYAASIAADLRGL